MLEITFNPPAQSDLKQEECLQQLIKKTESHLTQRLTLNFNFLSSGGALVMFKLPLKKGDGLLQYGFMLPCITSEILQVYSEVFDNIIRFYLLHLMENHLLDDREFEVIEDVQKLTGMVPVNG
jgi:hypothetical protein